MQIQEVGGKFRDNDILPCALNHQREDELATCTICKQHAAKIDMAFRYWFAVGEVKVAIEQSGLSGRVTTLDLAYCPQYRDLMTAANLKKMKDKDMPVVFGYSTTDFRPFLVVRFIDAKHNSKVKNPSNIDSFAVLAPRAVDNVCLEPIMHIHKFIVASTGAVTISTKSVQRGDGGTYVVDYFVKLIKGQLNGKRVD